tara:strand:- start:456 stop:770 length:315 start_codon:yes stop_codon:yes gene_type:complete
MDLKNVGIKDALGNKATVPDQDNNPVELQLFDAVRTILWTMPSTDLTLGDSIIARDVIKGMTAASKNGNVWNADDAQYEWLKKIVTNHATRVFGINAICVVEEL